MLYDEKIIIRNYKCFDSEGGGFERILPINIIIGKNNSGKSSLIDLIKHICNRGSLSLTRGRGDLTGEVLISKKIDKQSIRNILEEDYNLSLSNKREVIIENELLKLDEPVIYSFIADKRKKVIKTPKLENLLANNKISEIVINDINPLIGLDFFHIAAERDINPEDAKPSDSIKLDPNGNGATDVIQQFINYDFPNRDRKLIENEILDKLNFILKPDIEFERILVQSSDEAKKWQIYFEDKNKNIVPLRKMGSGIKTILLVLLNLHVKPIINGKPSDKCVFAFEELENNLHPALQRRLYEYIKDFSKENNSYFFITTHSNIVIDTFGTYENAQIVHVSYDGEKSSTKTVLSNNEAKTILNDLGLKSSDILQSNGIIWVEGPSDRNYINTWIKQIAPNLMEGIHYSILFYGGSTLKHIASDNEEFENEILPILKVNSNAFIVIDKDLKTDDDVNAIKLKIEKTIGSNKCWITEGREIENYLSNEVVTNWLNKTTNNTLDIKFENLKDEKIEKNISNSNREIRINYSKIKPRYSSEISRFITKESMDELNLLDSINTLISHIKAWNYLS